VIVSTGKRFSLVEMMDVVMEQVRQLGRKSQLTTR